MPSEHCDHCTQTESLDKDIRALFARTGKLTTQMAELTTQVALQQLSQVHANRGVEEIKEHLTRQDKVSEGIKGQVELIKQQISRWLGAITAIMAIVGIVLTVVQIFKP